MKLIRVRNIDGVKYVKDRIKDYRGIPKEKFVELLEAGVSKTDSLFFMIAFEGDEPRDFVILVSDVGADCVSLVQVSQSSEDTEILERIFQHGIYWTENIGKKKIIATTEDDSNAILELFPFEHKYSVVEYEIED